MLTVCLGGRQVVVRIDARNNDGTTSRIAVDSTERQLMSFHLDSFVVVFLQQTCG